MLLKPPFLLPGVGFACGLDRVVIVMEEQGCSFGKIPEPKIFVIAKNDDARENAQVITSKLRSEKIAAVCDIAGRSFKNQIKNANSYEYICKADEAGNLELVKNSDDVHENLTLDEIINALKN